MKSLPLGYEGFAMIDENTLRRWAKDLGFAKTALCRADVFEREKQIVAGQPPIRERQQLRFEPTADYAQARSLAVLLWPYEASPDPKNGTVFVDNYYYASNAAFHAARMLESKLLSAGCFAKANVAYPAKEAAIRAGLGTIGRHSLLITPEYGTRVAIILMATDIQVGKDSPANGRNTCLDCRRCIAVCPVGALDARGMSHPEKCLRNYMMEGQVVPENLREKLGMKLIGCDLCQRVCPMQPKKTYTPTESFTLDEFITSDQAQFAQSVARLSSLVGRNTARPQRVRAQAALLAGNSRNPVYLPVLRNWAEMPFEAVCEHARWAIGKIERETKNA